MKLLLHLAQTPSFIDPSKFGELLKFGQFGAALAMLILGFYLHWQASHSGALIEQRKGVARQFMNYAIIFFVLCAVGEILSKVIPTTDRFVTATLMIPPIDESNSKEYGDIQIVRLCGSLKDKQHALGEGVSFEVHDKTTFQISLQKLVDKLGEVKVAKQTLENTLAKQTPTLGTGGPQ